MLAGILRIWTRSVRIFEPLCAAPQKMTVWAQTDTGFKVKWNARLDANTLSIDMRRKNTPLLSRILNLMSSQMNMRELSII